MGEILRCWLRTRLGVIVDLRPEIFGRYTRDGSLLARILHSYDIVNRDQLATIAQTQDPALCRINLKHLRVWLRFLGIDCEDDTIEDISRGKGTAALRLFYKVYLCLESKDRLHFVTLRKERERFVPTSKKFDVTVVREDPPPYRPADHPSSRRLLEAKETLDWHRSAFRSILRRVEDRRRREHESSRRPPPLPDPEERARPPEIPPEPGKSGRRKNSEQADAFARAHRSRVARLPETEVPSEVDEPIEEPGRAREYPRDVKSRRRRRAERVALDSRARRALLSRLRHRLAESTDDGLDGAIARRVLDRAVYEKRIVARLCEVREQRKTVADNRRIVEELLAEAREQDRRATADREVEIVDRGSGDFGEEGRRLLELRERLRDEKSRKLREKHRKFCAELLGNLIDLAVKIAEYRRTNDGRVPRSIESEWRALAARGRSVLEDGTSEEDEEEEADEQLRDVSEATLERISIGREVILESYLEVGSPWDELAAMVDEPSGEAVEPGRRVLGYAVHRLLEFLYPRPASLARATRRPAVAAIVLGVGDRDVVEAIRALLARQGVRAVCLEDAINRCLSSYREQFLDAEVVDANVVAATDAAVARILAETGVRVDCGRRKSSNVRWSKSDESMMPIREYPLEWPSRTPETTSGEEEGGAVLTEAARLGRSATDRSLERSAIYTEVDRFAGKWVHELLTLGEPIPTALATRILAAHLASLETDEGWALVDYPTTYDQMRDLEESLTGRKVPPDPRTLDFESVDIEEIEPSSPRIVFEDETADAFASFRRSRLLPDPLAEREDEPDPGTFVTVYAKLVPRPRSLEAAEDGSREDLPPDAPSIDAYYAARGVARVLYHSGLDGTTLRRLARLVLGDLAREKSSAELFGDALDVLPRDPRKGIAGTTGPIVRRLTVARAEEATEERASTEKEDGEEEEEEEAEETANHGMPARPGEIGWPWVDLPLPAALRETLARAWVCLERAYVRDLEEILFVRSVHVSGVVPYKESVTRQARSFLERPDERRSLLRDFQDAFNAVDPDAREDADVKCELHRRLGDLQTLLWELCDRRRREAEAERRRLAEDRWTVREARVLLDVYAGILRAETERCVETVRLLRDYYGGMLREGQPPRELGLDRLLPERAQLGPDRAARLPEKRLEERSRPGGSAGTPKASRTPRTIAAFPAVVDPAVIDREITESLVEPSEARPDASESSLCRAILETARCHRDVAEELRTMVAGELGREEAAVSRARRTAEGSPGTGSASRDSTSANLARQAGGALAEWRSAVTYELERARFRLELLVAAARADVAFLLDTVRDAFRRIRDDILDRYQREAETVARTARLYGLAIEEARPIESEAILEGDLFVLRRDVVSRLASQGEATTLESGQEADLPFRFSGPRLARLADILARVAVEGVLTERALVYVLRDAASHAEEDGEDSPLPPSWGDLTAEEVADLVGRLFGPEDRIDWREFVLYATDLPLPSHRELLRARQRFVAQDPELGELVDRDRCLRTPLWFDESPPPGTREESWEGGETSARDGTAATPEVSSELRELLCRMYSTDRRTVNYTALLLAFCKDEDPREGLGKALSLAIGRRVCTDAPRGERYVEELLERKRPRSETGRLLDESGEGGSVGPSADESLFDGFETEAGEEVLRREDESSRTVGRSASGESPSSLGDDGPIAYWISRDVFLAVLAASLPCRGQVSGMSESLREAVALAYEELRDDTLTDEEDVALAHRLLRHELVTRLLAGTNRFTGKSAARTAGEILRGRKNLWENRR